MLKYFFFLCSCFIFTVSYLQHSSFWDLQRKHWQLALTHKTVCMPTPHPFCFLFFLCCRKNHELKSSGMLWVWMPQQGLSICRRSMYKQLKYSLKIDQAAASRNLRLPLLTLWLKQIMQPAMTVFVFGDPHFWSRAVGSVLKRDARLMLSETLASPAL